MHFPKVFFSSAQNFFVIELPIIFKAKSSFNKARQNVTKIINNIVIKTLMQTYLQLCSFVCQKISTKKKKLVCDFKTTELCATLLKLLTDSQKSSIPVSKPATI